MLTKIRLTVDCERVVGALELTIFVYTNKKGLSSRLFDINLLNAQAVFFVTSRRDIESSGPSKGWLSPAISDHHAGNLS